MAIFEAKHTILVRNSALLEQMSVAASMMTPDNASYDPNKLQVVKDNVKQMKMTNDQRIQQEIQSGQAND